MSKRTLKDLREAGYNPRIISQKRLDNLGASMVTYGDLSGVVFNIRTKTLISGHQRLKNLRKDGIKTKIESRSVTDAFGTVAEGYIVAKTEAGTLRIPYREVDWSDKRSEKAANIAANAHGGDFDHGKLAILLEDIQKGKSFDIDVLGIDPLMAKKLLSDRAGITTLGGHDDDDDGVEGSGIEFDDSSFEFDHTCPKCSFQFNSKAKPKAKEEPKPKAPKLDIKKKKKKSK